MAIHKGEFDVEILRDLIAEGYEGQKLLEKFKVQYERIHVDKTISNAVDLKSDFDVEILRDLIAEGYEGQELLEKFIAFREKIPAAFVKWMQDLIEQSKGESYTLEEVFGKTNKKISDKNLGG